MRSKRRGVAHFVQVLAQGAWFVRAYAMLLQVHWQLKRGGWNRVRTILERKDPARVRRRPSNRQIAQIERAVLSACDWQIQPVACLARSIVAYRLLLKAGAQVQLKIGFRAPVMGHAWVEAYGLAIADEMTPVERDEFEVTMELPDPSEQKPQSALVIPS